MWSRVELKTRAKEVLKNNYWKAFLVSLVILLGGGSTSNGRSSVNSNDVSWNMGPENFDFGIIAGVIGIVLIIVIFIGLLRVFLGYILEVGGRKYFIAAAKDCSDLNYLGFGFEKTKYIEIIKTMFYKGVLVFLWTLLLIIPGIVKNYAYRMVPYILADNPSIGYKRAIELSNDMTMGHKFDIWVLDLSFLGWYFLGALAFGIGTLFVRPYDNATNAELYLVLRESAIRSGMCTAQELNISNEKIF